MPVPKIAIPADRITDLCRRRRIAELSLFGSVIREDFRADSDLDVLVAFHPDAHPTLFDLVNIQQELETIFGRKVDLAERQSVETSRNEHRRRSILDSRQVLYAA